MASILCLGNASSAETHLVSQLRSLGFQVRTTRRLSEAERLVKHGCYDGMLIQCAEGIHTSVTHLCCTARELVSLIIVLMDAADIPVEARLLDCGVDDVVAGDHACPELVIRRIKVRLHAMKSQGLATTRVRLADVIVDFERRTVRRDGTTYPLSGILVNLLQYFVTHADHVISRQELNDSPIWADSVCTPAAEGGKTFDVHVSRLRKLIEGKAHRRSLIRSVRGIGWKLEARPMREPNVLSARSDVELQRSQLLLRS